jgi:hypothetical protein
MLSIDWVQINAMPWQFDEDGYPKIDSSDNYKVVLSEKRAKNWKKILEVFDKDGEQVAVITTHNTMPDIPKELTIVKVLNHKLYESGLKAFCIELLLELKLSFKAYSRLDICYDFCEFEGGVSPVDFLDMFFKQKIIKSDKTIFKPVLKTVSGGFQCDSIKYGSEKSELSYILYNKTQEMKDKTDKPYIREAWKRNLVGRLTPKEDVYRLEFSIKSDESLKLVNVFDGEVTTIREMGLDAIDNDKIEMIYRALLHKYWDFRWQNKQKNITRKERIIFFSYLHASMYTAGRVRLPKGTNRAIKMRISMLCKLNAELRKEGEHNNTKNLALQEIVRRQVVENDLVRWAVNNPKVDFIV